MNPDDFAGVLPGAIKPSRSYLPVLGFAAIAMAATSAVLTWNDRDFRDATTAAARAMCESQDPAARGNAIVVLTRDALESVATLRRLQDEGGPSADHARNALRSLELSLR